MLDWNDLRFFLAVARANSTIGAAELLKVNQSTVQRRLTALEEALGRKLVERLTAGYRLTELGLALRPQAEAVEAAIEALERQVASIDTELAGTIRVTCAEGIAYLVLTPLLERFHGLHPGVKVDVVLTDRNLDLAKGEADVALRAGPLEDSALIGRKIADLAWGLYAAPTYAERYGRIGSIEGIDGHSVIQFDGERADIQAARWLREYAPDAKVVARCSGVSGALLTARSGVGLAILPSHIGDTDRDLVRMFGPIPGLLSPCSLLAHPDLHKTPRVRAFFDFMIREAEVFRPLLRGDAPP